MILIIVSIIMGYIGINIGSIIGPEVFMYLFGAVGILSPGLYVLEQIYKDLKKNNSSTK